MSRVKFAFDKEKDAWNIWGTINAPCSYGRNFSDKIDARLIKIARNKELLQCKDKIIEFRKELYSSGSIEKSIKSLKKAWEKIEGEYFKKLEKITKKPVDFEIKAFITTISKCPYNSQQNWLMVSFLSNLNNALKILGHEIMHLHFHKYYFEDLSRKIGKEKTHEIKEALTVLLNLEFMDLWDSYDQGYEAHKELRELIAENWNKTKNFELLISKAVEFVSLG